LDIICHKAKSRYTGSVITSMRAKNSAVNICHDPAEGGTPKVSTTAKDRPKANSVQITAIACFVFIETSTSSPPLLSSVYVDFSFSITLTGFSLNKYLWKNLL
jgi:hypothetical protein